MLFWMGEEKPEFQGMVKSFDISGCGDEWCIVNDPVFFGGTWEWYIGDSLTKIVCPD